MSSFDSRAIRDIANELKCIRELLEKPMTQISYLCNGEKCADCFERFTCRHTTDIAFAENFKKVADRIYVEKEDDQ